MDYIHRCVTPLGGVTLASDGEALIGLWFDEQRHFGEILGREPEERELPVFALTGRWLDVYFGGAIPDFTPPLRMRTTPFRQAVWELLLEIPYGQTATYGELAGELARRMERGRVPPRAVGGAVGHNAVSLIVPCHRVVGADGSLTGYAGGLERKRRLLALEGAALPPSADRACLPVTAKNGYCHFTDDAI